MSIHSLFSPRAVHYLLKRRANQFFVSVAIRKLALGMVTVFEPIFFYLHFGKSLPLVFLYFGAIFGLYGLLVVYGGKVMAKIGLKHSMLCSHFFYFAYFLCLYFLNSFPWLVLAAIVLRVVGRILYWPPFHTDFVRFSEEDHRGKSVGKLNIASFAPVIIAPGIGGLILGAFGYQVLFVVILVTLISSAIPLFYSEEDHEVYTDSYQEAWERIFKKGNRTLSLGFASYLMEWNISRFGWPLFMFVLSIQYSTMGWISTLAIGASMLSAYYLGKLTDQFRRSKLLDIGAALTSFSWVLKTLVKTPVQALLARSFYRVTRTSTAVPYKALFYDKADVKGPEADEFIIYREIVGNLSRLFLFMGLAGLFVFTSDLRIMFVIAAVLSLLFSLLGNRPKFGFGSQS